MHSLFITLLLTIRVEPWLIFDSIAIDRSDKG